MGEQSETRRVAPYGSWESPIATEMLTAGALRFDEIDVDGGDLYWVESRPDERGRYAAMRYSADGELNEVTTSDFSARTLVHEYGGGSLAVADGVAYFSNFTDQRLYRRNADGSDEPAPISPELPIRYADAVVDEARGRLICVVEDHRREGLEAENYIGAVPIDGSAADADDITRLHEGFDFCSSPRLSPDGRRLAWVCWNHPNMPWDATELWLAEVATDGALLSSRRIAGDAGGDVSITEPLWGSRRRAVLRLRRVGLVEHPALRRGRSDAGALDGGRVRAADVGILDVLLRSHGRVLFGRAVWQRRRPQTRCD